MVTHLGMFLFAGLFLFQGYDSAQKLDSAAAVTGKMRQRLDGVRSVAARYSVTTYLAVLDQKKQAEGLLYLQRAENRLRLEEVHQTIISDGESVWTYLPENRQVIVSTVQESKVRMSPDEFLFNKSNQYQYDLEGQEEIGEGNFYVLKLTPVEAFDGISELRLWVDADTWLTRKVVYSDDVGSEITLRFMDFQLNHAIPSHLFRMTPAPDIEWVDLR